MKNKTDIQTKNQQIDKILQEQYDAETKILESALLNVAGKTSWDEFPEESEEKIRAGYDRLITRLRETGDFNEAARAEKTGSTGAAKEKLESLEYARGTLPCLMCRSLEQILASVTFTTASRSCISTGFGFSINSNFPFETYV